MVRASLTPALLGLLLLSLDRPDEGYAHIRWARELDPMSLIVNTLEAGFLLGLGRRDEAAARLARAFELEPDFWVAHLTQAGLPFFTPDAFTRGVDAVFSPWRLARDGMTIELPVGSTEIRYGQF